MKSRTYSVGLIVLVVVSLLLVINKVQCRSINATLPDEKPKLIQLKKSSFDHRDYHNFTLKNGLEIILVNDQQQINTTVSLAVGKKQYQPKRYYGVSHLLEHILINKIAQDVVIAPNNSKSLPFAKHSISFQVGKDKTKDALMSLAKHLSDTHYTMNAVKHELAIIHQEQLSQSKNPNYIFEHINTDSLKNNLSKYHTSVDEILPKGVISNFQSNTRAIEDIKALLVNIQNKNYIAKNMKLVVIGSIDKELLIPTITRAFIILKAASKKDNNQSSTLFNTRDLAKHLYLKTAITEEKLILQFPIELHAKDHIKQPYQFLQYMLANKLPGSLYATLLKQGLITNLVPTFEPNKYNSQGAALIEFTLTQQGLFHKKAIVAAFFRYLHLIKSDGLNIHFALGFAQSLKDNSMKYNQLPSLEMAQDISHRMLIMPAQAAITGKFYFAALDTSLMQKTIAQFSLNKLRLWHISNDQSTDTTINDLLASYRIKRFSRRDKREFLNNKISVSLPRIKN